MLKWFKGLFYKPRLCYQSDCRRDLNKQPHSDKCLIGMLAVAIKESKASESK